MDEYITVVFINTKDNIVRDIEIPIYISGNELVLALNEAYKLNIDISDSRNIYLRAERPMALIKGEATLRELKLRNGTQIYY